MVAYEPDSLINYYSIKLIVSKTKNEINITQLEYICKNYPPIGLVSKLKYKI